MLHVAVMRTDTLTAMLKTRIHIHVHTNEVSKDCHESIHHHFISLSQSYQYESLSSNYMYTRSLYTRTWSCV